MAEWQIIKSNNFSRLPPDESPRPRSRWRWYLLMSTILVFLATIVWLALRDQLAERRTAMREDLLAFVFEEETHRFLGNLSQIEAFDVIGNSGTALIQVEAGEVLDPPVWSLYPDQVDLAVLAGPTVENTGWFANRLLITSPEQPDAFQLVAQAGGDERFAMPVFCTNGALLYRVEQKGQYHLRGQIPGLPAETLLTLDSPFRLLACS